MTDKNVESFVQEAIKSNKVVIFSKTYCPYCTRAKQLFKQLGIDALIIELDTREDGKAIQDYLAQLTGQQTIPNIFINGKHVGGCDAVTKLHSEGKLIPLVQA